MKYDINLKKTQLGYQFDRNVFIGYQTNDNRVVTVKELKGYIGGSGGGGGGGGGGIQSITLTSDPSSGQITLTVDGEDTTVAATNVVAAPGQPPATATVCVITQNENEDGFLVYPTDTTWLDLLNSIPQITWNTSNSQLFSIKVNNVTKTLSLSTGLTKSVDASGNATTLSIDNSVVRGLSITNSGLSYTDGGGTHSLGGVIGTTPITTLSIATKTSTAPSDDAVVTVGYLNTKYQGGNVYYTENDPTADPPSDMDQTKFIFVEVN